MNFLKKLSVTILKLYLFWIILFDFHRIIFSIFNYNKFNGTSFFEWVKVFFYSIRVDLAMASFLSMIPFIFIAFYIFLPKKWIKFLFYLIITIETLLVIAIQSGETNAYPEWNTKLTTRVFKHLANPDEVVRTADYSMTIWFFIFAIVEFFFIRFFWKKYFKQELPTPSVNGWKLIPLTIFTFVFVEAGMLVVARGGVQQIPLNTDSAYFSNNHVVNDVSVNSVYFFLNGWRLYQKSDIGEFIPKMDLNKAEKVVAELYNYPKKDDHFIFNQKKPNFVFIILEGWSADVIGCLGEVKKITPNFDQLAKEGLLFSQFNANGGTSDIGNASIFSGYPALPEISMSMLPNKHRHLKTLNQDLKELGYYSSYIFSGDLKYGNIGSFFIDHGFDHVVDENDFDQTLPKGKLNFYDQDLFKKVHKNMNGLKEPFMQCAFTGSTHSPYDHPKKKNQNFKGIQQDYVNSVIYADECIGKFIQSCKKEKWYKNTVFVFVADHGHPSPLNENPNLSRYFRIPLLFFGEPIKSQYRGFINDKIGMQSDIPATILYQLNGDLNNYPWSKDLMNPNVNEFALHTINRGFGWINKKGSFTFHMDTKAFFEDTFSPENKPSAIKECHAFLNAFYKDYLDLDQKNGRNKK